MVFPMNAAQSPGEASSGPETASSPLPDNPTIAVPNFFPPDLVVAHLSKVRDTQPIAALAAANQYPEVLTDVFLQAIERGLGDPAHDFANHGMLFNYSAYFLSKWREPRAFPLFIRWFSLEGENALELGGDTVTHDGARFLASVSGGDTEPLKALVANQTAHPFCRGQALLAIGVLAAWGAQPVEEAEQYYATMAREGLERKPSSVWSDLARACVGMEFVSVFPELRRAGQEGLIDPTLLREEILQQIENAPRGELRKEFAKYHGPIGEIAQETRWWAGFQRHPGVTGSRGYAGPASPYVAPAKIGRNDPCPCGSGKKFKKCCGQ